MTDGIRRLAAYLVVVLVFAGGLFRLEELDRQGQLRACRGQQANRNALVKVVDLATRAAEVPSDADDEMVERIRSSNAARAAFRAEVLAELPPVRC